MEADDNRSLGEEKSHREGCSADQQRWGDVTANAYWSPTSSSRAEAALSAIWLAVGLTVMLAQLQVQILRILKGEGVAQINAANTPQP